MALIPEVEQPDSPRGGEFPWPVEGDAGDHAADTIDDSLTPSEQLAQYCSSPAVSHRIYASMHFGRLVKLALDGDPAPHVDYIMALLVSLLNDGDHSVRHAAVLQIATVVSCLCSTSEPHSLQPLSRSLGLLLRDALDPVC